MKCLSCFTHTTQEIEQNNTFEIKQWIWIIEIGYSTQPMHFWIFWGGQAFLSSICSLKRPSEKSEPYSEPHKNHTISHRSLWTRLGQPAIMGSPAIPNQDNYQITKGPAGWRSGKIRTWQPLISPLLFPQKNQNYKRWVFFSHIEVLVYRRLPSGKLT